MKKDVKFIGHERGAEKNLSPPRGFEPQSVPICRSDAQPTEDYEQSLFASLVRRASEKINR